MDIQAYIQSGIIESYVLGLASSEEIAEVEKLRLQHSEVEQAIDDFAMMLENQAAENAIDPPTSVKVKLMAAIKEESEKGVIAPPPTSFNSENGNTSRVVAMRPWRLIAAASVILLVLSATLNLYLYNKFSQKNKAYQALLLETNTLQANNQIYQSRLITWDSTMHMMADPAMAIIKMKDPTGKQNNLATVFWNTKNKEVFVMPNKLPQPIVGKQYQLWAMVDGKPVDAGVLSTDCVGACKMKTIPHAQAFAITLEKEGGSPTPDLNSLYVMGKV